MRKKSNAEMGNTRNRMTPADALVIFGVTGDLAHKMIFPALYAMARRAYELYEQRSHRDGHADQDWLEAEREIRKNQAGCARSKKHCVTFADTGAILWSVRPERTGKSADARPLPVTRASERT